LSIQRQISEARLQERITALSQAQTEYELAFLIAQTYIDIYLLESKVKVGIADTNRTYINYNLLKTKFEEKRLLKSDKPIDNVRFIDYARKMAGQYCAAKTFSEVYYGARETVGEKDIFPGVELSLNNLLTSDRFSWIREKALVNKDGWVIEPPGYGETRISGMKAYCKVDFLFPVEGSLYILDWKTGKKDEIKHSKQLLGYATWASYHFDVDPAKIKPSIVYLQPVYSELEKSFSIAATRDFINQVKSETEELYCMCRDIQKNAPKEKIAFKQTDNKFVCKYCNYKELCDKKA